MKFIFWQNILSIHQSAFIKNLSLDHDVILIAAEGISKERQQNGWVIPDFGNAIIELLPDENKTNSYLKINNAIHIFSGIDAFPMVFKVLKQAQKLNLRLGIQLEVFESSNLKGLLRKLKYYILQKRFGTKIDFLLVMSETGCREYQKVGFNKNKIFNWGYFTEGHNCDLTKKTLHDLPRIIYVGRLDHNKNILGVLPTIVKNIDKIESLTIVGDGILQNHILDYVSNRVIYKGVLSNTNTLKEISRADILILPSYYDGWGAVVNEALMTGTKVICSDGCGASDLINKERGRVFSYLKNNFEKEFLTLVNDGPVSLENRRSIINWAYQNISGRTASDYFCDIIDFTFNDKKSKPTAPWIS